MTKEEIEQVEKYFNWYFEIPYRDSYGRHHDEICKKFYHKEQDVFHIIIFTETNQVYQLNTDHEIYGIELETFKDLRIRFESFTGEKIYDIQENN